MTGKDLFREVGNINEKYITEAEETKKSIIHNVVFRRSLGTAACLVLCVGIFAITRYGEKSADAPAADSAPHFVASSEGVANIMDSESMVEMEMAEQSGASDIGNNGNTDGYSQGSTPEDVVGDSISYDYDQVVNRLQGYSNEYEDLLNADAFVVVHGTIKAGWSTWERFLEESFEGVATEVDLIEFTVEGDAIITAIVYDGETYHVVMDCTRDAWGTTGIVEYEYNYLYTDLQDGWTEVVLSDLELEGEEIRESIMSDGLDIHYLVQYRME